MNVRLLAWLTFGVLLGLFAGDVFGKGVLRAPFIFGTLGALIGLVGFFAVSAIHRALKLDIPRTNYPAILGAVFGGIIVAISSLGRLMISIFNPDLLEWEFETFFSATGGAILGGLFGACLAAAIGAFFSRAKKPTSRYSWAQPWCGEYQLKNQ